MYPTNIINTKSMGAVTYTVLVDGMPLDPTASVAGITVYKSANKIPTAQLVILDGDPAKQKFEESASQKFIPGNEVEIKMGYDATNKTVFKGIIIKHSIQLRQGRPMVLVVELKDPAVKMTIDRKNRCFYNKTDRTIIKDIISEYGKVSFDSTSAVTTVNHEEMVQYYSTDWDFILARAEANGCLVFAEDGKIKITEPNSQLLPKLNLTFGINVYEFEAEMDARDEYEEVIAKTWDDAKRKVSEKTSSSAPKIAQEGNITANTLAGVVDAKKYLLQSTGKITDGEMTAWAKSKLMRSRLAKIKGYVKIEGFSGIKPGDIINVNKFSPRFNNHAYVSGVTHELTSETSWYTTIHFGYNQEWFTSKYKDVTDEPASGLLPAVNGLVIALVKDIDKTDTDLRVKVDLPLIETKNGNKGVWARYAAPYAGQEYGVLFRPEVGDEVVVGFLNDDPREPVVLGSLHSSNAKGKTPVQVKKENYLKGIFTKAKLKIQLDDEKKVITIETPNKNKITISDDKDFISLEDKNKNKILMDDKGITITSDKKITLDAKEDIIFKTKKKLTQTADKDVTLKSSSGKVDVKASTILTLKGSSKVDINPPG